MMTALSVDRTNAHSTRPAAASRWAPLTGVAFAVLFIASVAASSPPSDNASSATWIANYSGSHRAGHVVTGICLVLAGLCLLSFVTSVWHRIAAATTERVSPLPVAAAAVGAACMSVGGLLMGAAVSVTHSGVPADASLLRFCNDVGFIMVGLGAMLAMSLAVAVLSAQAARTGIFGPVLSRSGYLVAVVLLAGLLFLPIAALVIWAVAVAITLVRRTEL
jgi:hypothetical protein